MAVALCLTCVDAAIAGANRSSVALMASAVAAVLGVGSVILFWKRPLIAASFSLWWLTAAFAASSIVLGSADAPDAIALSGLTTGDTAAALLTLAIVVAAIAAIASSRLPAMRALLALAAIYALAPLLAAFGHGGLRAALTGTPLSAWRGAYVAIEVLLPLASFAAFVGAVMLLTRRRGTLAATAFILALSMLAANQTGAYTAASAGVTSFLAFHSDAFGSSAIETESPQKIGEALARAVDSAAPEDSDLPTRAKQLKTADAAFAYVRDNIGFESYSGILRGAETTFSTRAGNALDRALLLADILNANNISTRFATGRLGAPQAELLYARMFEPKAAPAATAHDAASSLRDRVLARADHDEKLVRSALGNEIPAAAVTTHDDAIKEIQQHAWVQARINSQWIDLDPALPDATVGHTYASVDRTSDTPPPELMQQVTIRVTTETLNAGALATSVALETTVPAYKLNDQQVFLVHAPPSGMRGLLSSKDTLRPILLIDGEGYPGTGIAFGGGSSTEAAAGALDEVNAALSARPEETPAAATGPQFVAEWLEFEVTFPDGHRDSTKRVLVDRAGTAWRRAATLDPAGLKALPRNKDGLLAMQTVYNLCFSAGKHNVPAFANTVRSLLNGDATQSAAGPPAQPSFLDQAWPLAIRDLAYFMVSDQVFIPALNDVPGLRIYADSPRIFVFAFGPDPSGQTSSARVESDFRRDSLRAVARDSSALAEVAAHKLRFGMLEGALEDQVGGVPHDRADGIDVSTSSLAEGGGVTVLRPGSRGAPAARAAETAALIQSALDAGDTLVVPNSVFAGGAAGWWQIARGTGDVRAVLGEDLNGGGKFVPEHTRIPKGTGVGGTGPQGAGTTHFTDQNGYRLVKKAKTKNGGGELGAYALLADLATSVIQSAYFKLFLGVAVIVGIGAAAAWAMTP